MLLQSNGSVGKSFVAFLLAQYKINQGQNPICIDTDPVNSTFHSYQKLNVHKLSIMEKNVIHDRHFDELMALIESSNDDAIVDNGALSFLPLSNYLLNNNVHSALKENGSELIINVMITGGQAFIDTLNNFGQLVSQFPENIKFVIWLNPYWGPIEDQGKSFEQLKVYEENKSRVSAIVKIPELNRHTFGRDLSDMLKDKLTFDEALAQSARTIITRQRLIMIQREIFGLIDIARIL